VLNRVPSVEKANLLLGWKPRTTLEEAVRMTVEETLAEQGL